MKQKNKEILLNDLCARLPYGVRCSFGVDDAIYEICGINPSSCGASEIQATHIKNGINGDFKLTSCKPYLFPLSSITEEQKKELKVRCDWCDDEKDVQSILVLYHKHFVMKSDVINWCYKNHLDVNNLIPNELAIDCTNLNIY